MSERVFVTIIPALAVSWVIVFRILHGWLGKLWKLFFVGLCFFTLGHYYHNYSSQVRENRTEGIVLDKVIDRFFNKHKDGRLVCVSEEFYSKYCATGYAYNRYRSDRSIRSLPTLELFDRRVIVINSRPDRSGNWAYPDGLVASLLFKQSGPLLVVANGGAYRDHLLDMFRKRDIDVAPAWRWLEIDGIGNALDVDGVPGGSFFASTLIK